jgi:peptidoglycan/LPS O-acetylase OafA/YrhL
MRPAGDSAGKHAAARVFGLDLMRATAIGLVLVAHASFMFLPLTHALEGWWMLGHLGVELFFVLSGFLIGGILATQAAGDDFRVGRFWTRRWLRTLPNYYLFLLINIAIARWTEGAWPHAAPYAAFVQNLAWPQPIFFIEAWSLSVEEIFYLLAPLLVLAFRPLARRVSSMLLVVCAIAAATAVRAIYVMRVDPNWDLATRMVSLVRMDAIAYGVLAVLAFRHANGFARRHVRAIALLGAIGTAIGVVLYLRLDKNFDLFARTGLFSLFSASFAAFLPLAATWRPARIAAPVERAVRAIARWSYALYLCQLGIMRVLNARWLGHGETFAACLAQAIAFVAISLACAAFVYRFFEAPILRWRDRWTRETSEHEARSAVPAP